MRKITNKKADIGLSFGVIFSIILIAVFIFAAIYAINFFLNYSKCLQIVNFYDDLQGEVNRARSSHSTEGRPFKISLPGNIKKICFANLSEDITNYGDEYDEISMYYLDDVNLFLIPGENGCSMPYKKIDRINISRITALQNPFCVDSESRLLLTKGIYDRTVFIEAE